MAEYEGCERPIVEALVERGWEYVPARELPREEGDIIIIPHLKEFVMRDAQEKGIELRDEDFNRILMILQSKTGVEGYRETLRYLKLGHVSLNLSKKGLIDIKIIDYENPERNKFVVSNQVTFLTPTGEERRPDVVLFVNGIPLVVIECKSISSFQITWYDAFKQLRGYEKSLPELFRFVQINVPLSLKAMVYPTMPWIENDEEIRPTEWKEKGKDELEAIANLLRPENLLDLIKNFVFIAEFGNRFIKIMPRYMQYEAVRELYRRTIEGEKGGVVWHWQGSGKTYTMIFAAYKLYRERRMKKPTIFFVIDRKELEEQLFNVIKSMDLGGNVIVERIDSIKKLEEVLKYDGGRGKRGFFVVLIQKFKEKEGIDLKEIEKLPIVERENIVVFVDEAHRTQYGILAARMRRVFKNARILGFTGTPLLKGTKNTFKEFGSIIHKYFIKESIDDGYTVPIMYTFTKEKGVHLNKKQLEKVVREIIPEGYEEEVTKRLHPIIAFQTSEKRMRKIAADIVEDFLNNRRFKGMVVAPNRKACVLYRRYIMDYLKERYPEIYEKYGEKFAEVVITYSPGKDDEEIERYREEIERRYGRKYSEVTDKLRSDFKVLEKTPKLIIVTDMLLTGYDVPVLEVMYLDKIMNGHTLLQAIARTNRPYQDKGYGVVVDYVGIFRRFTSALSEYYEITEEEAENAAIYVEDLKELLRNKIDEMCRKYKYICANRGEIEETERKAVFSALYEIMRADAQAFLNDYRELKKIYNALGGNEIKADDYIRSVFKAFSVVYVVYQKLHGKKIPGDVENIVEDVENRIRELVRIQNLKKGDVIPVDIEFLENLEKNVEKKEAVVDMSAILSIFISTIQGNPVNSKIYGDIVEYIQESLERWKKRKSTLEEFWKEQKRALEKIYEEKKKIEKAKLKPEEYAILKIMEKHVGKRTDLISFVREMTQKLRKKGLLFEGWYTKIDVRKEVKKNLRIELVKYLVKIGKYNKSIVQEMLNEIVEILPYLR